MHLCISNQTIIGSHNGLLPSRGQVIIWTNDGILLVPPLGTNLSEILIEIHIFSLKKMLFKWSSGKWQPFCPGLNVLRGISVIWLFNLAVKRSIIDVYEIKCRNKHIWEVDLQNVILPSRSHAWSYRHNTKYCYLHWGSIHSQITKFMGPTWGPPGSCQPQMGPMLAPWILLSGMIWITTCTEGASIHMNYNCSLPLGCDCCHQNGKTTSSNMVV